MTMHNVSRSETPKKSNDLASRLRAGQSEKQAVIAGTIRTLRGRYVTSPVDKVLNAELDELRDSVLEAIDVATEGHEPASGRLIEGRALVVTGGSGTGKRTAPLRALNERPEFEGFSRSADNSSCCIAVTMPSLATLRLLCSEAEAFSTLSRVCRICAA
jgi:hypothetical protein